MVFTSNFEFLKAHGVWFYNLAASAERNFSSDPNTTLIKMRQLGEAIAHNIAARVGVEFGKEVTQHNLLKDLDYTLRLESNVREAFYDLKSLGNSATHEFDSSTHRDALKALIIGHSLASWFHSTFGGEKAKGFNKSKFVKPEDPSDYVRQLEEKLSQITIESQRTSDRIKVAEKLSQIEHEKAEAERLRAERMAEEREIWEQLAHEQEEALANYRAEVERENKVNFDHFIAQPKEQQAAELQRIEKSHFEMDEAETRCPLPLN